MPDFLSSHYDAYERLAIWRREILVRMNRLDELAVLPAPAFPNLAAEQGAWVEVGDFLGTANVADPSVVYAAPERGVASQRFGDIAFAVEDQDHPVLVELRRRFELERIAGEGTALERIRRIRDWLKSVFPHGIPLSMPAWNALFILDRATRGVEDYICVHYSVSLVQCCIALGIPARMINLHRGISDSYRIGDEALADPPVDEHVVAEAWCEELGRWVMFDTDFDCDYSIDGVPGSAWDIHRAFIEGRWSDIVCNRGPLSRAFTAYGEDREDTDQFFARELPSYYAHVSILMRNDFLADPDGPVTVAHPVDEATAPILWHRGSDNRLQRHLMGPVVVAQPWTDRTDVLVDGNIDTSWASSDAEGAKALTVRLAGPRLVAAGSLHWAQHACVYHSSRAVTVDVLTPAGDWQRVWEMSEPRERGFSAFVFEPIVATAVRVTQPPGGGSVGHPDRLWLSQVGVFAP